MGRRLTVVTLAAVIVEIVATADWLPQAGANCPNLTIPAALSCTAKLAVPLCGYTVLDAPWKSIDLKDSKSPVTDCCTACSNANCSALEVRNSTCRLWATDPVSFDIADGVVTAFRGKGPGPTTCEQKGNKMLGELCYLAQPQCEYCGNNEVVAGWKPCLDNSTAAGPCRFPIVAATATYKGKELARSLRVRIVENNYYFPREDIDMTLFSEHVGKTYQCTWKGECFYYNLTGQAPLSDAMWSYEARGVGHCRQVGPFVKPCLNGYTCADIIGHGSFLAPDVNITVFDHKALLV